MDTKASLLSFLLVAAVRPRLPSARVGCVTGPARYRVGRTVTGFGLRIWPPDYQGPDRRRPQVYAIDAAPSLVEAFRNNFPQVPVACESAVDSLFFERTFEGVLAWGLMFLFQPDEQRRLIQRIADILVPGGRLLFTSEAELLVWKDAMTGLSHDRLARQSIGPCSPLPASR